MQQGDRRFRIVIAGGGTGGHVLPAIAVREEILGRGVDADFLWIGSHSGIERQEAERAGIAFSAIQTGKMRRYFDLKNATDAVRVPLGFVQAANLLRGYRPDVVFSTGGFVSVPTVAASRLFAPVVAHEQTATLGLANKVNSVFATSFAVSYPGTLESAGRQRRKMVLTGNPVRSSLQDGSAPRGLEHFGFSADLPVVYVTGGAKGASPLNQRLNAILPELLECAQIVHQTGDIDPADIAAAQATRDSLPERLRRRYVPRVFIGAELADLLAAASLVVGRAGAGTVADLAYVGRASILIPLPRSSSSGEQYINAGLLEQAGAAVVIDQDACDSARLLREIKSLLENRQRLDEMGAAAKSVSSSDAAAKLADIILAAAHRH